MSSVADVAFWCESCQDIEDARRREATAFPHPNGSVAFVAKNATELAAAFTRQTEKAWRFEVLR